MGGLCTSVLIDAVLGGNLIVSPESYDWPDAPPPLLGGEPRVEESVLPLLIG